MERRRFEAVEAVEAVEEVEEDVVVVVVEKERTKINRKGVCWFDQAARH